MKSPYRELLVLLGTLVIGMTFTSRVAKAQATGSPEAQALVKQGRKLNSEGKQDEALKLYKQALEISPNLYEAHLESGVSLDLKGDYAAARAHLEKAIEVAPAEQKKNRALRTMAVSYAFEKNSEDVRKASVQCPDREVGFRVSGRSGE